MDFSLSAEQRELKAAAIAFARRELDQDVAKRDDAGEFAREAWRACAKFGIQGLPIPEELGGGGADILTTVVVMEALGYGCHDNGLIFSLNAQMWSLELPLVKFGRPEQQKAYLPGLMSGDLIGVHAMTEPDSGSDAFSMRTHAERQGDQAVHHQCTGRRRGAGLLRAPGHGCLEARRHLRLSRRQGDTGVQRDARHGEDGPADIADGRDRAGRLRRPGRKPPRA
jgi:alkylation response protein AidB-like acyl-CoA dehydrogenase